MLNKRFILSEQEKKDIRQMYGQMLGLTPKTIKIEGRQRYPKTDWDLVHGILGSKRLDDDLEKRVSDELQKSNCRVTAVRVNSSKQGSEIVTVGEVDLTPVQKGQNPHKHFATRGSIGNTFSERHDKQVVGLKEKLEGVFGGPATIFGPYIIEVKGTGPEGKGVKFKQSFFAIEDKTIN